MIIFYIYIAVAVVLSIAFGVSEAAGMKQAHRLRVMLVSFFVMLVSIVAVGGILLLARLAFIAAVL